MKLPKPLLVTFDAFGTLYSPKNGAMHQYAAYLLKYHGVELDESAADRAFRKGKEIGDQAEHG
jgi:FMN phosphatase YigB (HAD superfamily)